MTTESNSRAQPLEGAQPPIGALVRTIAAGALAGFVAGLIAGGIGSRIAMRISAMAAGDRFQGVLTDFEAPVGDITADGTIFLVLLGGATGAAGGIIYAAMCRWVADAGGWRGLMFGALLLAIFGSAIIRSNNPDFHQFGPPALNIAMFAVIFIVYGLLLAPIFEAVERRLPPPSLRGSGLGSVAAHGFGLFIVLIAVMGTPLVAGQGVGVAILPYVLLVMPIGALLIRGRAGRFERLSDLRGNPGAMRAALALLGIPVLAGLALNGLAIAEIYEANR